MSADKLNIGPRLSAISVGLLVSVMTFTGLLRVYLDPPRRPLSPDAVRGYTSFVHAKHGDVYGTHFEQLTATYGPLLMITLWLIGMAFEFRFFYVEERPRPLHMYFVSAALSMAALATLWMLLP
jgi:hypothetical protein